MFLSGCCNCNNTDKNLIKGYITVIGNEPFTQLAIVNDKSEVFILECEEGQKNELWKRQGDYFIIGYDNVYQIDHNVIIKVNQIIPIRDTK